MVDFDLCIAEGASLMEGQGLGYTGEKDRADLPNRGVQAQEPMHENGVLSGHGNEKWFQKTR